MASLFDSDDSSSSSEISQKSIFRDDLSDDDATTFTVATVLEKRAGSRRDTITRTMPTISIDDKSDVPAMVETKQAGHHPPEERRQLRITSSLMDDASDSEHDGDELHQGSHVQHVGIASKKSYKDDIFRTPSHQEDQTIVFATKSTILRRNTYVSDASKKANLLDKEVGKETGIYTSPNDSEAEQKNRRQSTDTFMSLYEDFGSKQKTPSLKQTKSLDYDFAAKGTQVKTRVSTVLKSVAGGLAAHASSKQRTPSLNHTNSLDYDFAAKGTQVKTRVATALKTVAGGLAARNSCDGVGSWDVEQVQRMSGKKRGIDSDEEHESDHRQRNRRKSLNIREELTQMQDTVHERTEECASLKRKLEESESQIQALQNENSIVIQSKIILESKLYIANEARTEAEANSSKARSEADASNARVESLCSKLKESQSDTECLRLDVEGERQSNVATARAVDTVKQRLQEAEFQLKRVKRQNKDVERERESLRSRTELQEEMDRMRSALRDIKELEVIRSKKTQRIEAELRRARLAASEAESTVASLRSDVEELKKENVFLRAQSKETKTPLVSNRQQWNMEWEEGTDGIEIAALDQQMSEVATPNVSKLDHIKALGAEDGAKDSKSSDHASKVPLKAIFPGTPDNSSRQLSFASNTLFSPGKENNENTQTMDAEQPACSQCFRPPRRNGIVRRCQCGNKNCNKWAHATCIVNIKSVSTSVSHPGTPAPALPTILCRPWDEN